MLYTSVQKIMRVAYRFSTVGLNKGPHITRYCMYQHLSKYALSRSRDLKVLSISNSEHLGQLLGFQREQIANAAYPEFNILSLPFQDASFDAVVSDQVLEHVEGNPQIAINEAFRVLKPGGIALHTTCFINPIHGEPKDFWRFTPEALDLLVKSHGTIIDVGGWGNPYAWLHVALGLRFEAIPNTDWHPAHWVATKNMPSYPIVTWVLAKKEDTKDDSKDV